MPITFKTIARKNPRDRDAPEKYYAHIISDGKTVYVGEYFTLQASQRIQRRTGERGRCNSLYDQKRENERSSDQER